MIIFNNKNHQFKIKRDSKQHGISSINTTNLTLLIPLPVLASGPLISWNPSGMPNRTG